jgi:hypothetical protein
MRDFEKIVILVVMVVFFTPLLGLIWMSFMDELKDRKNK